MKRQPSILLSYNHKDEQYASDLRAHIRPLEQRYNFNIWDDQRISTGDSWKSEIEKKILSADIAILLVSADFLASEWLSMAELPQLLEKAKRGETRVLPVILRPSAWAHTPLAYYQALPRDARPLATLSEVERDQAWADLYDFLEAELHRLIEKQETTTVTPGPSKRKSAPVAEVVKQATEKAPPPPKDDVESLVSPLGQQFFISHAKEDGDFAENLKGRMKEQGIGGWIDIDVLEAGVDWRREIDEAILKSPALILVLSPDSKASEYVTYEWAFALGSGKRIIPLMVRDTPIHPRLEAFQYLDFTNRRARPWTRLFSLLRDVSGAEKA